MNNLGGGANIGNNAQSLAAEGVVERGRWVWMSRIIANSFKHFIHFTHDTLNSLINVSIAVEMPYL